MLKICGKSGNISLQLARDGVLASECFLDVLSVVCHVLFFIGAIPILIGLTKLQGNEGHAKSWVHFPCHRLRYVLSILLIILNVLEICEGFIADADNKGSRTYLYLTPLLSFIGSSLSIVYYHHVETGWNSPRFLVLLFLYWIAGVVLECLKFLTMLPDDKNLARFAFTLSAIVLYGMLVLLELWVWRKLKYCLFPKPQVLQAPDFLVLLNFTYDYVSLLSKATFCWVRRTIHVSYHRTLTLKDLGHLPPEPEPIFVTCDTFQDLPKVKVLQMLWFILKTRTCRLIAAHILRIFGDLLEFVVPLALWYIIAFVKGATQPQQVHIEGNKNMTPYTVLHAPDEPYKESHMSIRLFFCNGYVIGVLMTLALIFRSVCLHNSYHLAINHSLHVRAAIQMGLCDKMTRLIVNYRQVPMTSRLISTLVAESCTTIPKLIQVSPELWATPLRVLICMLCLYYLLGPVSLVALFLVAVFSALQVALCCLYENCDRQVQPLSKVYLNRCQEFLRKIKHLKMYCWETMFSDRVVKRKQDEVKASVRGSVLAGVMKTLSVGSPMLVSVVVLSVAWHKNPTALSTGHIFISLLIIDMLCQTVYLIPYLVSMVSVAVMNLGQVQDFLDATEVHGISIENKGRERRGSSLGVPPVFFLDTTFSREIMNDDLMVIPSGSMELLQAIPEENSTMLLNLASPKREKPNEMDDRMEYIHIPHTRSASMPDFQNQLAEHEPVHDVMIRSISPAGRKRRKKSHGSQSLERGGSIESARSDISDRSEKRVEWKANAGGEQVELNCLHNGKKKRPQSLCTQDGSFISSGSTQITFCGDSLNNGDTHSHHSYPAPSYPPPTHHQRRIHNRLTGTLVRLTDASFAWDETSGNVELSNINLNVEAGQLYAFQGQADSGRSTLIAGLLGELRPLTGEVLWKEGVRSSLVNSKLFIMNASVKDNILFGHAMNNRRYQKVLHACALNADIGLLPAGDMTQIGNQGLSLSPGQRQRICIARALYSHSDLIFMDDPFQYLDTVVAGHILDVGFRDFLLAHHRTVIITCDTLENIVGLVDKVVCLKNHTISIQGSVEEVRQTRPDLFPVLSSPEMDRLSMMNPPVEQIDTERQQLVHQVATLEFQHITAEHEVPTPFLNLISSSPHLAFTQRHLVQFPFNSKSAFGCNLVGRQVINTTPDGTPLSSPDHAEKGGMPSLIEEASLTSDLSNEDPLSWHDLLCGYMRVSSMGLAYFILLLFVVRVITMATADLWLVFLINMNTTEQGNKEMYSGLMSYAAFGLVAFLLMLVSLMGSELSGLYASLQLCKEMLSNIAHASLRFFDKAHSDVMLRRFAEDLFSITKFFPATVEGATRAAMFCLAAILVNSFVTPYYLVPALLVTKCLGFLHVYFKKGYRYMRVMDDNSQPCIAATMSRSLIGLAVIRAARREVHFLAMMRGLVERAMLTSLWVEAADRWLHVRVDFLGASLVLSSVITSVTFCLRERISVAFLGFAILYAYWMSHYIVQLVRWIIELEMYSLNVNRCLSYTQVPPEEDTNCEILPPTWPGSGKIEFIDVTLRYDMTLQPTVKRATFHIKGKWKVAICGQLGSGKSTLALGLLRMLILERGHIRLGDRCITQVPLEKLRSKVTVISQDVSLCQGTLRFNLDPSGRHVDTFLWSALEVVHLKDYVTKLKDGLDTFIGNKEEDYFSPDEMQLFSLAQAYLRDTPVLVIDEPIGIVSSEHRLQIQEIITSAFPSKTVLFLATRIFNPSFYDRILVMKNGHVIAGDKPQVLQSNPQFAFFFDDS